MSIYLLLSLAFSFSITVIITPFLIWISYKRRWFDYLDERKVHTEATPRIGGLGIFLGFWSSLFLSRYFISFLFPEIAGDGSFFSPLVIVGFAVIHLSGLIDDFREIRAVYKLSGQILGSLFIIVGDLNIQNVSVPFTDLVISLGPLSGVVTVFWMASLSNALNLIDGIDGLAGGISFIAAAAFGIYGFMNGNDHSMLVSVTLLGSLAAFLLFNLPKARIFMGDSGSIFLGTVLAVLVFSKETNVNDVDSFIFPITVLFVPIADMITAILRRVRERAPIHAPDRRHLHHKLLDLGFSVKQILLIVYSATLLLSAAALIQFVFPQPYRTLFVLSFWALVIGLFYLLHVKYHAWLRKRGTES